MTILPFIPPILLSFAIAAAPGAPVQPSKAEPTGPNTEYWVGTFFMPDAAAPEARFIVTFTRDPSSGEWAARLDIPSGPGMSGSIDVEMKEVVHSETTLGFLSPAPPAENVYETTRQPNADTAEGRVMVSRVQPIPISLHRITQAAADSCRANRPQSPRPPLPYSQRDVSFTNPDDGTTIGGTLTIPTGTGPFPCIALLSDTGPHSRDHEEGTHKPFLVLADQLARRGYATLRTDTRGLGRSGGSHSAATLDIAAQDALAALVFLKSQPEIDPGRIGLLGRGEGAVVAAKAATSPDTRFVVLLAPAGFPGAKVLEQRESAVLTAQGDRPEYIQARTQHLARTLGLIVSGADDEAVRAAITDDIKSRLAAHHDWGDLTAAQLSQGIDAQFAIFTTPRSRSWLAQDPGAPLSALKCPVLALFAELDMDIPTQQNLPKVKSLLSSGTTAERSVIVIPAANHFFQRANTGFDEEHDKLDETLSHETIDQVTAFLSRQLPDTRQ